MSFGRAGSDFLINSPAAVGQCVQTRLGLWKGEWFLDTTEGTPWSTEIIGKGVQITKDMAIRKRILQSPGVTALNDYSSVIDAGRKMSVSGVVDTQFSGQAAFVGAPGAPSTFTPGQYAVTEDGVPGVGDGGETIIAG